MSAFRDKRYNIMVVDDNATNLAVAKQALSERYDVTPATSGEKALALLAKIKPDLILLDIEMQGLDGFQTIQRIKSNPLTEDIPVIFLTLLGDSGSELEGLQLGAVDYISKPFSVPLLLHRIDMHIQLFNYTHHLQEMVLEKTEIIKELQYAIVHTITDLVDRRDGTTGGHITRTTAFLGVLLGGMRQSGCYAEQLSRYNFNMLVEAAQLHDLGKIAIPDSILLKPGKLTQEEFEIMKRHPLIGHEAIMKAMELTRDKEFLMSAAVLTISHHEKWNGAGYPYGLSGEDIPLLGRLMAIPDVYDALVSERPYKKPFSHQEAVGILKNDAGTHFDPKLIDVFLSVEQEFYETSQSIH